MRFLDLICVTAFGLLALPTSASVVMVSPAQPLLAAAGQHDRTFELQDVDFNGDGLAEFQVLCTPGSVELFVSAPTRIFITSSPPPNLGGSVANLEAGMLLDGASGNSSFQWYGGGEHSIHDLYPSVLDWRVSLAVTGIGGSETNFEGLSGYFGIEFQLDSGVHYGWIQISESESYGVGGLITGWAYESDPGTAIVTGVPEPSAIHVMGLGVVLMGWYRRRRRSF